MAIPSSKSTPQKLPRQVGLIAGWGRYPYIIAENLKRQGVRVVCLAVSGHAEPELAEVCDHFEWVGLGKLGLVSRRLKQHGVTEATMAGKIHKVALFQPWRWVKHLPDWTTIRIFAPHFLTKKKDCRDDSLLTAVMDFFDENGVTFHPATDFAPELLITEGCLTRREPTDSQWRDIEFGWEIARQMGRLDVGQSVVVKDQAVMAIEAVEGTDLCIERAGQLCKAGGFTVIKTAKPQQDMRFDVPTVGTRTLRTMLAAGGRTLAIEAGRTVVLEQEELLDFADRHKIAIVSLVDGKRISRTRDAA